MIESPEAYGAGGQSMAPALAATIARAGRATALTSSAPPRDRIGRIALATSAIALAPRLRCSWHNTSISPVAALVPALDEGRPPPGRRGGRLPSRGAEHREHGCPVVGLVQSRDATRRAERSLLTVDSRGLAGQARDPCSRRAARLDARDRHPDLSARRSGTRGRVSRIDLLCCRRVRR